MAISAFHYPFYDQLGSSVHTRLRLFALPCALLLRRLRDLCGPGCRPFLCRRKSRLALCLRIGAGLLQQSLTGFFRLGRVSRRASASAAARRSFAACSAAVICFIASKDIVSPSFAFICI